MFIPPDCNFYKVISHASARSFVNSWASRGNANARSCASLYRTARGNSSVRTRLRLIQR